MTIITPWSIPDHHKRLLKDGTLTDWIDLERHGDIENDGISYILPVKKMLFLYGVPQMYGGQYVANAIRAGCLYMSEKYSKLYHNENKSVRMYPSSIHSVFMSMGLESNGACYYHVTPLKIGKTLCTLQVTTIQGTVKNRSTNKTEPRKIYTAILSFHAPMPIVSSNKYGISFNPAMPREGVECKDPSIFPNPQDIIEHVIQENPGWSEKEIQHIRNVGSEYVPASEVSEFRLPRKFDNPVDTTRRVFFLRANPDASKECAKRGIDEHTTIAAWHADIGPMTLPFGPLFGNVDFWNPTVIVCRKPDRQGHFMLTPNSKFSPEASYPLAASLDHNMWFYGHDVKISPGDWFFWEMYVKNGSGGRAIIQGTFWHHKSGRAIGNFSQEVILEIVDNRKGKSKL